MKRYDPRVLTRIELEDTKAILDTAAATIDDFRSVALSIESPADIQYLLRFFDSDAETASRALTSLYYWGCVGGIGEFVAPWLSMPDDGSTIHTFGPSVMSDAVITLGDVTAYNALQTASLSPPWSEIGDLHDAKAAVESFVASSGEPFRRALVSGELWEHGAYIIQKIRKRIPVISRFTWYLKSLWPDSQVFNYLESLLSSADLRLTSLRSLVGFWDFVPTIEMLASTDAVDENELTALFNITLLTFARTRKNQYWAFLRTLVFEKGAARHRDCLNRLRERL